MPPTTNIRHSLVRSNRCFFFVDSDLLAKYSGSQSIFHSNIHDEINAAILNDGDGLRFPSINGRPSIAPKNGQVNEHCRGPNVPVKYVPSAIAKAVQNPINNNKNLFCCHASGKA
jgi:hypothetical protein